MANTVWNNESLSPSYIEPIDQSANIVRLVEDPEIVKTIQLDELSMTYNGVEAGTGTPVDSTELVGVQYPIIRINDITFLYTDIYSMTISSEGFIPTIELTVSYPTTILVNKNMPKDGDIVSTYIRTNTSALNFLRNDFIITECDVSNKQAERTKLNISGKLFIDGIDAEFSVFGVIGNSKDVCKHVAKLHGIGFAYNDEEETKDYQNWICSGSIESFVNDVVLHSWKDPDSFFKAWIDLYYNLCFVNVNKFLLSEGQEDIDITFASLTAMYQGITDSSNETIENAAITVKLFSNMTAFRGTPFFVLKWRVVNNSSLSLSEGYSKISYTYMHNQSLYNAQQEACFSTLYNYPSYDPDKANSHMILRGRCSYDPHYAEDNEMARVNYDLPNRYVTREWGGIEYTVDDSTDKNSSNNNAWTGNVHKNYSRAPMHNNINNMELEKMYIEIITDGLCLQVMRGEKVPIVLENDFGNNMSLANNENLNSIERFNRMYSGFYIVDSIEYCYNGNSKVENGRSLYSTRMVLKRREWPTPEPVVIPDDESTGVDTNV